MDREAKNRAKIRKLLGEFKETNDLTKAAKLLRKIDKIIKKFK